MSDISREALIALCERAVVPIDRWRNRDSAAAQRQVGDALVLLRAGATITESSSPASTGETHWIDLSFPGFGYFDWDGEWETETFYIPTAERLGRVEGGDWY